MPMTIPRVALTALALAMAYAQAATTAGAPTGGSVIANPGRTTTAPLATTPGTPATQTSMDNGPFSPAVPNPSTASPTTAGTAAGTTGVTASGPAATNVTTNPASTNANPDPFGPNSTFANDNGTETLGNPAGNGVATIGPNGTTTGGSFVAPVDVTGGGIAYGMAGGGAAAAPGYSASGGATVAVPATTPTPLLNRVTNDEINKEARDRAQGRTPRVIGIAPRTDVDRTNQMPDDPIIRY